MTELGTANRNRSERSAAGVYLLYIEDRRYSVPTLDTLAADDDEAAMAMAARRLAGSEQYLSAQVWRDEQLIGRLDKPPG